MLFIEFFMKFSHKNLFQYTYFRKYAQKMFEFSFKLKWNRFFLKMEFKLRRKATKNGMSVKPYISACWLLPSSQLNSVFC